MSVAQRERGPDALVGAGRGHTDVGDDDVGPLLLDGGEQLVIGAARAADRELGLVLEQRDDALANQQVVLGDDHPERHSSDCTQPGAGPTGPEWLVRYYLRVPQAL